MKTRKNVGKLSKNHRKNKRFDDLMEFCCSWGATDVTTEFSGPDYPENFNKMEHRDFQGRDIRKMSQKPMYMKGDNLL